MIAITKDPAHKYHKQLLELARSDGAKNIRDALADIYGIASLLEIAVLDLEESDTDAEFSDPIITATDLIKEKATLCLDQIK